MVHTDVDLTSGDVSASCNVLEPRTMSNTRIFFLLAFFASALAYDVGITNSYRYETTVLVSENCSNVAVGEAVGTKIQAKISLTAVWKHPQNPQEKLFKIQISQPKLLVSKKLSFEERRSNLQKYPSPDSFFLLRNNKVEEFWDSPSEQLVLRNLKRSVASLLQVKNSDGQKEEVDVSGTCGTLYKTEGSNVRRSKGNCHHPVQDTVSSQPYGVRSSTVEHSTGTDCEWENGVIVTKCYGIEHVETHSNLWKKASTCIQSTSEFNHEGTSEGEEVYKNQDLNSVIAELKKKQEGDLSEGDILAVAKIEDLEPSSNGLDSIKGFQESLKATNLAKLKSASAFFKLLPALRSASKEDIIGILKNKKYTPILPQILDILAASVTKDAIEAAVNYFSTVKNYDELLERYLISLSVLPKPDSFVLKEIKTFLEKGGHHEKIEASLVTTLGALLRTYTKIDKFDQKFAEEVRNYLEDALKKCKNDDCVISYLKALRNAAQPTSIPLLLEYASKGGNLALEALLAIRNMPHLQLSQERQILLLKIFHQVGKKQDRSSRAIAGEILIRGQPEDTILKSILGSLSDQSDVEFSTFMASKVIHLMEEDENLRSRILRILPEKQVAYYYSLSQKGKSSLFKRQLLSTNGLNVTYGIEMELLEGGLLKRSVFDVAFETDDGVSNLLSVGMFAGGLASLAGSESASDDGGTPTAGMELTLLGTSLRPYVFFSGTSELMGHAWSGTASELTPALQGIFSLSDDSHLVVLQNGMVVKTEFRAAMSTDLSAAVQISLWSRNSQSQVRSAAALLARGSTVIDAGFVTTRGEYQFYGQSQIDFSTDLEFYETPFKMCLQMEHPNVTVRHDFQKSLELPETKFSLKKTKKRKRFIPSRSYALHQNNNELCRIMKSSGFD